MLFDFFKKKSTTGLPETDPEVAQVPAAGNDDDIAGTELREYAARHGISHDEVWTSIKDGQLVARTENGFVYVYGQHSVALTPLHLQDLPPPPVTSQALADTQDLKELIEHLSSSRDQTETLLRFAEDSLAQLKDLNHQLMVAKDRECEALHERHAKQQREMELLQKQLDREKSEKIKLLREVEDLQMLTKAAGIS